MFVAVYCHEDDENAGLQELWKVIESKDGFTYDHVLPNDFLNGKAITDTIVYGCFLIFKVSV